MPPKKRTASLNQPALCALASLRKIPLCALRLNAFVFISVYQCANNKVCSGNPFSSNRPRL